MKVRDVMTTDIEFAEPESTLEEIATMMRDSDVGAVPILDADEELIGIITDRDIVVRCIAEGKNPLEATAEEILSEDLHTVSPEDDVQQAAELMSRHQIRRLPVVENGELVGMVSLGDLAVKHSDDQLSGDTLEEVSQGVKQENAGGRRASGNEGSGNQGRGGRRAAMESQSVRTPEDPAGSHGMRSSGGRGASREQQGITSHSAQEEDRRQERVVAARPEAKGSPRTGRKAS